MILRKVERFSKKKSDELKKEVQSVASSYLNAKAFVRFVADEFGYRAFIILNAETKVLVEIPEGTRQVILDVILREWREKKYGSEISVSVISNLRL